MTCATMRWVANPRTKAGNSRDRCFPSLCAGMITEIDGSTCMGDPVVQRLQRLRPVLETELLLDGRPRRGTHLGPELRCIQQAHHMSGDRLVIADADEPSATAVLEHFGDSSDRRRHSRLAVRK